MSDDAKKPDIKLVESSPESVFDDIEQLRKTATLKVSRKVVPVNVRVGKPANNVYFRVHPQPGWSLECSVIVGDGGSDDFFFVAPSMLNHHTMLPRLRQSVDRHSLYVAQRRDFVVASTDSGGDAYRLLEIGARSL